MVSETAVVNAITSCLTSFSISWMRATPKPAWARSRRAASAGTVPSEASASEAASSTSSHCWKRFWSLQIRPISGRVYRGIILSPSKLEDFGWGVLRSDGELRREAAALQLLAGDHLHDGRVIVVLAEVAQHQVRGAGIEIIREVVGHDQV